MALLQIETGANKGKRLRLPSRPIVVGRGDSADMKINSAEMSREHCRLIADGDHVLVEDLNSSNGTFVNGRPISEQTRMQPGDRVSFGPLTLRVMGVRKTSEKPKPGSGDSKLVDPAVLAKAKRVSEDDVSSWLNDDSAASSSAAAGEDTKILTSIAAAALSKEAKLAAPVAPRSTPVRTFNSVAEEAADIIRRHKESIGQA